MPQIADGARSISYQQSCGADGLLVREPYDGVYCRAYSGPRRVDADVIPALLCGATQMKIWLGDTLPSSKLRLHQ
jgi:hypothetical protein